MRSKFLPCLVLFFAVSKPVMAQQNESRCVHVTRVGGETGSQGKTISGILYPAQNKLIYDWKNGTMDFLWTLPEGMLSGEPEGFEGTWEQDGSRGSFVLKQNRKTRVFEGTWTLNGQKHKNKLSVRYCD